MLAGLLSLVDFFGLIGSVREHAPQETDHSGVVLAAAIALALSTGALVFTFRAVRGRIDRVGAIWAILGMFLTFAAVIATLMYLVAAWTSTPL